MAVKPKGYNWPVLKRIMGYTKAYKWLFVATGILTISLGLTGVIRLLLIRKAIDGYIKDGDLEGLLWVTILVIGVLIIEGVATFLQSYASASLGQQIIRDLRKLIFKHITSLKLKYFDKTSVGTLMTRAINDIEKIADIFSQGILEIIGDLFKLFVILVAMTLLNWQLTLATMITLPILIYATNLFKKAVKKSFEDVRIQVARLNSFIQEHITGMSVVQIFNREDISFDEFQAINQKHKEAHIRSIMAYSIFFPVVEVLVSISLGAVIWIGLQQVNLGYVPPLAEWLSQRLDFVHTGPVSFGDLTFFILAVYMLFRPIRQLADRFNTLQMGLVAADRVFQLLDTKERIESEGSIQATDIRGQITFKNLWFAYNEPEWVLKDLSFEVKAGEKLAIVGATGAGKSSIINLLSRFYEFQKGTIAVDGIEIRDFDLQSLRRSVGVVLQDVFLFSDSIYQNITMGDPEISRDDVIEAAKAVGAHDFIEQLPEGYDYNVRERGAMLSVGQRQLIAFIRAQVFNPRILVLDEATSSIDSESEAMIQRAADKLTQDRTSLIIAHRLSTIQNADRILVLEKGELIEQGSHAELLAQNGKYRQLYDIQFTKD